MPDASAHRWGIGALLVAALAACGGGPKPKILEIESILTSDTQTRLFRLEIEYEGNQVEEVYISADGETTSRSVPKYKDGRITGVEVTDADGESMHTTQVEYDGSGRVTQIIRGQVEAEDSLRRTFAYQGDKVQTITYADTRTNPITEELESTGWTESCRYDKEDRVDRITLEGLGDPQIQTLSWGTDGTLKGIALDIGGATVSDTFAYDDGGRVERVNGSDLRRYELVYGDHGYVLEVEDTLDDETMTIRYYYGDGSADGLQPHPEVPGGMFFDIEGHNVTELSFDDLDLLR